MMMFSFTLLSLSLISSTSAFSVTPAEREITVTVGEKFTLMCKSSAYYEWCTYTHKDDICDFEYKSKLDNVTLLECAFGNRWSFQGSYYSNECGLEVTATEADAGEWKCNMEEYWSGYSRGDGATAEETITVNVIPLPEPETPAPTIPTTEATTESTTATTTPTEATTPATVPPPVTDDPTTPPADKPEPVPEDGAHTDDNDSATSQVPVIPIVVAVCLIIIFGGLAVIFGLHYKRKLHPCFYSIGNQRWKPVMNNDDFPVTEDDEERHPTIIKNGAGANTSLDVSELGPMSEGANINPNNITTVTYTAEDKEEKKDEEKPVVEDTKKEEEEEKPTEETPLQDEENLNK